ncbi:MAG: S8 family serine peptidase [Bacteroidota bacterium]
MRKSLLLTIFLCTCMVVSVNIQAQVKGNPVFSAKPPQLKLQKPGSRLSPELQKLYDRTAGARKAQPSGEKIFIPNDALDKLLQLQGDRVVVDITIKGNRAVSLALLQQLGVKVTAMYGRVISGLAPIAALPELATVHTIQFARPAYRPLHLFQPPAAWTTPAKGRHRQEGVLLPVISQGDTAQRSYLAREKYKVSGKGVKIGILSDSYNSLGTASLGEMQGELPGPANPFKFKKRVTVLEDMAGGTDEGRAMAEIIHDVAPGAELAFHTASAGQADFAQGIQDLADKGCKVMVDDLSYLDEPFFQDGIIAQSVDLAKKKGVSYFSAAGNNYNNSYESDYRSTTDQILGLGNGTAHNFNPPGAPPREYQPIFIPPGGSFIASFQWDQPFFSAGGAGAESDLDIFLVDVNGKIVAGGTTNNILSGDPIEVFGFDNTTPENTFFLAIVKLAGPDPAHIKYNMYRDASFYITTPAIPGIFAPTLVGHAKAAGAITTGAAFYLTTPAYGVDTPLVEYFSSLGGVANYFDVHGNRIAPLQRKKPDIIAPDGGNTSFFDPFGNGDIVQDADSYPNFFGTSAAAPHAAGVAALMIEAEKLNNLTPGQIKGILAAHTVDMDDIRTPLFDKGFDLNTGAGFLKADEAVAEVRFPNLYLRNLSLKAVCSADPAATRSWKIVNPNPFEVATHWLLLGTNQYGSITAPAGESLFSTNAFNLGNFQLPNIVILDWDDNFGFSRLDIASSSNTPCGSAAARSMNASPVNENTEKPQIAAVYPNPASTVFRVYLALAGQQPVNLQLFSIDGRKLLERNTSQPKGIITLDAAACKPGVYLLKIKQGRFNKTIKLVKQ